MHGAIKWIAWGRLEKESSVPILVYHLRTQVVLSYLMTSLPHSMAKPNWCQQTLFLRTSDQILNTHLS